MTAGPIYTVTCDRCGKRQDPVKRDEMFKAGWTGNAFRDLCPKCSKTHQVVHGFSIVERAPADAQEGTTE